MTNYNFNSTWHASALSTCVLIILRAMPWRGTLLDVFALVSLDSPLADEIPLLAPEISTRHICNSTCIIINNLLSTKAVIYVNCRVVR